MRVLVTFAVEAEFAPWRKLRVFQARKLNQSHWSGGTLVQEAEVGGHTVCIYLTGMGIKCFDSQAASNAKAIGVDAVISSGLAGSLNPKYGPLTVVAPRRVGTLKDSTGLAVSKGLLELAGKKGATLVDGLLSSDRIIDSREEKSRLSQFADTVDMESFHVVQEFVSQQIPVAVIRAISDGIDEELPVDFEKCLTAEGSIKVVPLLKDLARQPGKIPALIRFGKQSKAAAEKLTRFLDEYIQSFKLGVLNDRVVEAVNE
jgi:adenosylhomocysteine nucleosidase